MAKTCEVELWVTVDADGDYAVGKDADAAAEAYRAQNHDLRWRNAERSDLERTASISAGSSVQR